MEGGDAMESPAKEGEGVAESEEFKEASGMEGECSDRGDHEREREGERMPATLSDSRTSIY
jgi:hypothetical protein